MSLSKQPVVWVHADCLSPTNPALMKYPGAPALFVWDDELLTEWRISFKRIVFIYECILELPVVIRRGDVVSELLAFAAEQRADSIVTNPSPSPRFKAISSRIAAKLPLQVVPVAPFVRPSTPLDLGRFSRYWRSVEADAMRPPDEA